MSSELVLQQEKITARQLADVDFQGTGGNENPYAKDSSQHFEYNDKFEALTREWADAVGSWV